MKHLRYCYMTAGIDHNENRHAQTVMKELGITYQHSTPQTIIDQWWFWCCQNIPEELPAYITELDLDPIKCIGFGLSKEEALKIINFKEGKMQEASKKRMKQIELATHLACMAYDEPEEIHQMLGVLGMAEFEFINIEATDTQVFCCRKKDDVYISFRGTEFTNFSDWATNLDCNLVEIAQDTYVHAGFYKDVLSAKKKIVAYLTFQGIKDIKVHITGQSQGAGDATVFGLMLFLMGGFNIEMIVPVASPRCLAKHTAKVHRKTFGPLVHRIVNNNDVVTRVPTRSMGYAHVEGANFYYIKEDGDIVTEISAWELFKDRLKGRLFDFGKPGTDGLKDHLCLEGYLQQIRAFNKR